MLNSRSFVKSALRSCGGLSSFVFSRIIDDKGSVNKVVRRCLLLAASKENVLVPSSLGFECFFHSASRKKFEMEKDSKSIDFVPEEDGFHLPQRDNELLDINVEKIVKIINDSPYPDQPLYPVFLQHLQSNFDLPTKFIENVLGRLFAAHSNGLKALEFFKFCLNHPHFTPSSDAFEKTLHILVRMRYFDKAWEFMNTTGRTHPSLLTLKSMSIMLTKIAKFQSYEDTLEAFERMEREVFIGRRFGTEEFNVLIRAFCTEREMKEARSVFHKLHKRFPPNIKTMNILLMGFKDSRDVTALELFYHEMVKRGFRPNCATYNIRIDAYCKKCYFGDALRLLKEMEDANCVPTLETLTTLIHGAGLARNAIKAREMFYEIRKRNMQPDVGAYNALISSLIKCREAKAAVRLMDEMQEKNIGYDIVTYHTMFYGLMKSSGIEGVSGLYHAMVERSFVPKARTVVMVMKFFCVNNRVDLALNFWHYLLDRGCCPHSHALDLLLTGLCSRGRLQEAFHCSKQYLDRGMRMNESAYGMLERLLLKSNKVDNLAELNEKIKKLHSVLPPLRDQAQAKLPLPT